MAAEAKLWLSLHDASSPFWLSPPGHPDPCPALPMHVACFPPAPSPECSEYWAHAWN